MPIKNTWYVLESPTGTDSTLDNHILTITGLQPMDFRRIESYKRTLLAAGASGAVTITPPTSPVTAVYTVVVSQYVKSLGKTVSATLSLASTAGVTSQQNICDAFRTQLTNIGLTKYFNIAVSGTTTCVITPNAPDNFVNVTSVGTGTFTTITTASQTARVGYGADLILEGFSSCVSTNYYMRYDFVHTTVDPKGTAGSNDSQVVKQTLLVGNGSGSALAGNASTLDTLITGQLTAVATNAATIEGIAIV